MKGWDGKGILLFLAVLAMGVFMLRSHIFDKPSPRGYQMLSDADAGISGGARVEYKPRCENPPGVGK